MKQPPPLLQKQPAPLPPPLPAAPTGNPPASEAKKQPPTSRFQTQSGLGAGLVRLTLLVICAGSCWLLYWSFVSRLQPVTRELQKKTTEMSRLADEVEQMRLKLERKQVEEIQAQYQAAQQLLFSGTEEVSEWEETVKVQAGLMRLEAICESGPAEPHPKAQDQLGLIKAQVGIRPAYIPGTTNSPYRQLLSFAQDLAKSSKRFDLLELTVEGDTNSVRQALAVVQLWSDKRKSP